MGAVLIIAAILILWDPFGWDTDDKGRQRDIWGNPKK